ENFPHLTTSEGSLVSRMWEMVDRAVYCPIVYNTLEAWKDELGFQPVAWRSGGGGKWRRRRRGACTGRAGRRPAPDRFS
ncbi:MAG: hypothetical protein ACKV22_14170, partial [Bryobacteraceae bacterium]